MVQSDAASMGRQGDNSVGAERTTFVISAQDTRASARSFLLLLIVGRLTGSEVSFPRRPTRRIYFERGDRGNFSLI